MPINPYFKDAFSSPADQRLVQSLTNETISQKGRDVFYLPRELVAFDQLYWEDKLSAFNKYYTIEMYIENFLGFGGQREFISKFGYEIRDEITLVVSKERFNSVVVGNSPSPLLYRPREGDLIFFPLDQSLFEITFCDNKEVFYQLGRIFTYRLFCKRFELAAESFNTTGPGNGITKINNLQADFGNTTTISTTTPSSLVNLELILVNMGEVSKNIQAGEVVYQGITPVSATWSATVVSFNLSTGSLIVNMMKGQIDHTKTIVGSDSQAIWALSANFEGVVTEPNPETIPFEQNTTFDYFDQVGDVVDPSTFTNNPLSY